MYEQPQRYRRFITLQSGRERTFEQYGWLHVLRVQIENYFILYQNYFVESEIREVSLVDKIKSIRLNLHEMFF